MSDRDTVPKGLISRKNIFYILCNYLGNNKSFRLIKVLRKTLNLVNCQVLKIVLSMFVI